LAYQYAQSFRGRPAAIQPLYATFRQAIKLRIGPP